MITYEVITSLTEGSKKEQISALIQILCDQDIALLIKHNVNIPDQEQEDAVKNCLELFALGVVALDGDKVVGVITVPTWDECLISELVVDPNYRRQGIAKALIKVLVDYTGIGYKLSVTIGNEEAKLFYKAIGFKEYNSGFIMHD